MSDLRIKYGIIKNSILPIFCIEIASKNNHNDDEAFLLRNICLMIQIATTFYNAKLCTSNIFLEADTDDEYPLGACCLLCFYSQNLGMEYIKEILSAFQ